MQVIRRRGWEIPERLATPEPLFLDRRGFLAAAGATALALSPKTALAQRVADLPDPTKDLYPAKRNDKYALDRPITGEGGTAVLRPCVGVATVPEHGYDPAELLMAADVSRHIAATREEGYHVFQAEDRVETEVYRGRIMADGKYVKVYMNDTRVANVPNADLGRSKQITIEIPGTVEAPAFLTNLTIMAGGKKLYDALSESGRIATQGIYFDTGSDRIRPESTPTLKEIGTMLKDHPDLRLTIEGHTDNVGSPDRNLTLSQQRAEAVRLFLIKTYGVEEARLEAKGLGASKPAAPNETSEGRQQNRRVALVKR